MRFTAATRPLDVDVPDGSFNGGEPGQAADATDAADGGRRNDGPAQASVKGSTGLAIDPEELLRRLTRGLDCLTHVERVPPRAGSNADWPLWVPADLRAALRARGVERPWSHQATAADLAHAGRHVVVSTGTASANPSPTTFRC